MLSTWLLILFVITLLILAAVALISPRRSRRRNPPPRPFPNIPFVGSVGLLTQRNTEYRHKALFDLSSKLGAAGIFRTQVGCLESYIVTSYALFREATIEKPMEFIARPTQLVDLLGLNPKYSGIVDGDGAAGYMAYRKFVLVKLRSLGFGQRSMEDCILNECQALTEEINFSNKNNDGENLILRDLLCATTANVIFSVLFSRHLRYDDKELLDVTRAATEFIKQSALTGMTVVGFPWLESVTPYAERTREAHGVLSGFIEKIIHERLSTEQKRKEEDGDVQDFLDICLMERQKDPKLFSTEMLAHTFEDLFLGGFETTATTLQWLILIMLHYPDLQEQLHREIDERCGSKLNASAMVTLDDTDHLPLTVATIWEVWRMYPLAPLGVPHATTSDTSTLGGYDIEPGKPIMFHIWSIHHDPKLWNEPEKFMPQRFLVRGDDDRMVFKNPEQVVVFSAGRRSCIGEQLARKEAFLLFANLLRLFSIKPKGPFPELRERPGTVMYTPDFQVDFVLKN